MRYLQHGCCLVVCLLYMVAPGKSQPLETAGADSVPRLVRFTGSFHSPGSRPLSPVGATFAIYSQEEGGTPLWTEDQNVEVDAGGKYTVLLGASTKGGVPVDLFSAKESRWLQVKLYTPAEIDPPRVLLVSVPYALRAGDAETLGGKPASAYMLAETQSAAPADGTGTPTPHSGSATTGKTTRAATPAATSGAPNYIGMFTNGTDLVDSIMYQNNSNVGVGTTQAAVSLDVRNGLTPQVGVAGTTDYLSMYASDFFGPGFSWDPAKDLRLGVGGSGLYNNSTFVEYLRVQSSTGNVGIGSKSPIAKLEVAGNTLIYGNLGLSGSILSPGGNTTLMQAPTNGSNNLAVGLGALPISTTGVQNTAIGTSALATNMTGGSNTAVGVTALKNNTTGSYNTAVGSGALFNNTDSLYNTAVGYNALFNNASGAGDNTAVGFSALTANTAGAANVAVGFASLKSNTIGNRNTALGLGTMNTATTASDNTALGYEALSTNTTGGYNTALGEQALYSTTGTNNIGVGFFAGWSLATGSNNVDIANQGAPSDSGVIRIGTASTQTSAFIAGIRGVTTENNDAVTVVIDSNGQLGTVASSRRFKEDIRDMGAASSGLMRLRPVTFRYKQPFSDGTKPVQYGLVAEEVAQVYPDLVAKSTDGQVETVKYQVLDSMLLNELQKQNATIAAQKEEIRDLQERLAKVEAALAAMPVTAAETR